MQQREQTFKETPHKARQTALCGVFLALTTFGEAYQKWYCLMLLRSPIPRRRPRFSCKLFAQFERSGFRHKKISVSVCRHMQDLWRNVEKTTQFRRF
ncbi:hypothetical protein [Ruminococcus sp. OM06-36AC]|uniref:hypothetical protein n=1 Tax=Ruminococcus TaxID=1263 RepID=UPI0011C1918A|nr:hypothetical protein [Ruminococcus sp. OM06-36AC]